MDKKMNNEELQSRREFFKKAAKAALPMIAFAAFGQTLLTSCKKDDDEISGCGKSCSGSCDGDCAGDCDDGCWTACISACVHYQK